MGRERLISADSHVAISVDGIRERVPVALREAFDDAIAQQAAIDDELKGGSSCPLDDWDMEAFRDPGYREPVARLAAMDRDGVDAEVLYSEVSAFRAFGLVKGDWKPISRAFTDLMAEFASVDPNRLVVSYQVPIIDIDYAVSEVAPPRRPRRPVGAPPQLPERVRPPRLPRAASTTRCGAHSRRPASPSATISATGTGSTTSSAATPHRRRASSRRCRRWRLAEVFAWWILTGTLERFPGLKIVFVEPSLYWIPGFLASLDRKAAGPYDFPGMKLKPSEYFHRNMACTFMDDEVGLQLRHLVGDREHPLVHRLPPPGHHVAELAGGRRPPVRRHPRRRARADLCRQRGTHLRPLAHQRRRSPRSAAR